MNPLHVIIVDDEPIAQEILETYILKIPGLSLVAKCRNALEAYSVINKQQVDLMLLDINMPEISGIDFLKTLKNPPQVILTTAYAEFALESYELNAIDYLLKPIPFERFFKAIDKVAKGKPSPITRDNNDSFEKHDGLFFVKSGSKLIKLNPQEIWLVEGLKDYVKLCTEQGNIVVHSTMKNIEEQLSSHRNFIRMHKSFIINLKFVSEVNGNMIKIKDIQLAIGNTYKEEVQKLFQTYKLI